MKTVATLALAAVAAAQFEDIRSYETFVPKLIREEFASNTKYASHVEVQVEYQGQGMFLDLDVDTQLLAEDWFLETTDPETGVVTVNTNRSDFMCHYQGSVRGIEDSHVVMSLCEELGMRGTVHTEKFNIEIQHAVPLNEWNGAFGSFRRYHREAHIVYSLEDVIVEGLSGEPLEDASVSLDTNLGDDPRPMANAACVTASDASRMNAFGSGGAETSNTQSVMAQSNNRYRASSWTGGSQLTMSIAGQVQRPAGWSFSTNMQTYLRNLSTYKNNNQRSRDNVVGLTHTSFGGTIGLAWLNTMCQAANSCGLNNVGWSSSDSARGVLVAHEIGHNFAFAHDTQERLVMWPSIITNAARFSRQSIARFQQVRGNFRCL